MTHSMKIEIYEKREDEICKVWSVFVLINFLIVLKDNEIKDTQHTVLLYCWDSHGFSKFGYLLNHRHKN